jgi:hypothetical protein
MHDNLFADDVVEQARVLRDIFTDLLRAGEDNDYGAGMRTIERAVAANIRPVDVLIGMIAPMLFEIGEEWERGALSVEAEHRFTVFCERITDLVETTIVASKAVPVAAPDATLLFAMNAPGNRHLLGLRILALWAHSHGARARIIEDSKDVDGLMRSIAADKPKYLLVSMALAEQRAGVAEIAKAAQTLSPLVRPRVIVGGYPVKARLIRSIPGAELLSDINALEIA